MTSSRTNIVIAVLTGILVGFVFGATLGTPGESVSSDPSNAGGNIGRVAPVGRRLPSPMEETSVVEEAVQTDTTRFEAFGKDGENLEIIIVRK